MVAMHQYFQGAQTFAELLTNASREQATTWLIPIAETYVAKLIRSGAVPPAIDRDDLMQEARFATMKAVRAYRPDGGRSLKSFLFFVLHRHIMRYAHRQLSRTRKRVPLPSATGRRDRSDAGQRRERCRLVIGPLDRKCLSCGDPIEIEEYRRYFRRRNDMPEAAAEHVVLTRCLGCYVERAGLGLPVVTDSCLDTNFTGLVPRQRAKLSQLLSGE